MPKREILGRELKSKGLRLTPQRLAILEHLRGVTSHPTAEEIFAAVRDRFPGLSLATVYNTLNTLSREGLILELSYGDAASHFDGNPINHYHISCRVCGRVVDFAAPLVSGLEQAAARVTGFLVEGHRVELTGLCPQCQRVSHN